MFNFHKFKWIYKQQLRLPGFPKLKPEGYKPPSLLDPNRDPKSKGYRIGTVREWQQGRYIKTPDGWFPFRPDLKEILVSEHGEDQWAEIGPETARGYNSERQRSYPTEESLDDIMSTVSGLRDTMHRDEKQTEVAAQMLVDLCAELNDFREREKKHFGDSLTGDAEDALLTISDAIADAHMLAEHVKRDPAPTAVDALAKHILNSLDEIKRNTPILEGRRQRRRRGHFRMEPLQEPDDASLKHLAAQPVEMGALSKQGSLNLTLLRVLEDGTETVCKSDAFSISPGAKHEGAAYLLARDVLNSDAFPATLVVRETPWSDELIDEMRENFMNMGASPPETSTGELATTSIQEYVKGIPLFEFNTGAMLTQGRVDAEKFAQRVMEILTFDHLAGNWDRNQSNLWFTEDDGMPVAIDNGDAFKFEEDLMEPKQFYLHSTFEDFLEEVRFAIPDELNAAEEKVLDRIKALDPDKAFKGLKTLLDGDQIGILQRRLKDMQTWGGLL